MKTPYDQLPFIPALIAVTVCGQTYTGQELGGGQTQSAVERIETARQQMTPEQVARFASYVDERCRVAYERRAPWLLKCARSKSNLGRDQLYVFIRHWLAAYLLGGGSMQSVSEQQFKAFIVEHNAIADGFRPNGGYVQTRWYVNGREVARRSQDSRGVRYEIADTTGGQRPPARTGPRGALQQGEKRVTGLFQNRNSNTTTKPL